METNLQCCISFDSYIKPQLLALLVPVPLRCISFDSYIKPQLGCNNSSATTSCISFDSYIKPQHAATVQGQAAVVYLLIPTSNHNLLVVLQVVSLLYIF